MNIHDKIVITILLLNFIAIWTYSTAVSAPQEELNTSNITLNDTNTTLNRTNTDKIEYNSTYSNDEYNDDLTESSQRRSYRERSIRNSDSNNNDHSNNNDQTGTDDQTNIDDQTGTDDPIDISDGESFLFGEY